MSIKIFIYGSLKEGFHNHDFLKNQITGNKKVVQTIKKYPLYNSESYCEFFPYLEDREALGEYIKGEMYEVNSLTALDCFEGVPELYKRGTIEVADSYGIIHKCCVYFRTMNLQDYRDIEFIKEYTG